MAATYWVHALVSLEGEKNYTMSVFITSKAHAEEVFDRILHTAKASKNVVDFEGSVTRYDDQQSTIAGVDCIAKVFAEVIRKESYRNNNVVEANEGETFGQRLCKQYADADQPKAVNGKVANTARKPKAKPKKSPDVVRRNGKKANTSKAPAAKPSSKSGSSNKKGPATLGEQAKIISKPEEAKSKAKTVNNADINRQLLGLGGGSDKKADIPSTNTKTATKAANTSKPAGRKVTKTETVEDLYEGLH